MTQKNYYMQADLKKKKRQTIMAIVLAVALLASVFVLPQMEAQFISGGNEDAVGVVEDTTISLVKSGYTQWQYWDKSTPPPEDKNGLSWKIPRFAELTEWKTGRGTFGAEDGKRTDRVNDRYPTNLPVQSDPDGNAIPVHYFRTEFTIEEKLSDAQLKGSIQFDDAVVVFLNGEMIYSDNVPEGGYDEESGGYGAARNVDKSLSRTFTLSQVSALRKGQNVLAVELHQNGAKSSDLYFDFLSLTYSTAVAGDGVAEGSVILEPGATQKSMRVNWITTEKRSYAVQFAAKDKRQQENMFQDVEMEQSRNEETGVYSYSAMLNNLQPGVTYEYRVVSTNRQDATALYTFSVRSEQAPVSFLMVGDPQIGADTPGSDLEGWERTLGACLAIDPNPAFLYSPGDLVDSSDLEEAVEQSFLFRSPKQLRQLPLLTAKGNHDSTMYRLQFDRSTESDEGNDSFVYGDTLFVRLNTSDKKYENQRAFLEKAVRNHPTTWVVVLMHYSMFSTGPHAKEDAIVTLREEYAETFSRLNVDLVLSGHDHLYSRTYLMNGAVSTGKDGGLKQAGETMYVTGNSASGSKYYGSGPTQPSYLAALNTEEQPFITQVQIRQNELRLNTYRAANRQEVDSVVITK